MKPISLATLQYTRWGFDLDGVLAVKPPPYDIPWMRMNGPERQAARSATLAWYAGAEALGQPDVRPTIILSARKATPDVSACTLAWLEGNDLGDVPLYLLSTGRTIRNVAAFKVGVLRDCEIDAFVEDNRAVLKAMAALLPEATLFFWDKDSPATPELFYSPLL
jgi:hypothetical protein